MPSVVNCGGDCRTGEKGDSHGMTAFAVEKGTPGFTSGKKER